MFGATHARVHARSNTCRHTFTQTQARKTQTQAQTHTHTPTHIQTLNYRDTHKHKRTHADSHTRTQMYARVCLRNVCNPNHTQTTPLRRNRAQHTQPLVRPSLACTLDACISFEVTSCSLAMLKRSRCTRTPALQSKVLIAVARLFSIDS